MKANKWLFLPNLIASFDYDQLIVFREVIIHTTFQRFGVRMVEILYFFAAVKWSVVTVKPFIILQKVSISNKCSFECSIQRILKMRHGFHKNIK